MNGYVVVLQKLTHNKPLDPVEVMGREWPTMRVARQHRWDVAVTWQMTDPEQREIEVKPGAILLKVKGYPGLVGYLLIEDRRAKKRGSERYKVVMQGETVARVHTKEEASKILAREVARWRSSRYPRHTAIPRYSGEWGRQVLIYDLKDRDSYAGDIHIESLRR